VRDSDVRYLIDTGPLLALYARKDGWHEWAVSTAATLGDCVWTSEAVVTEAAWNLGENTSAVRELLGAIGRNELRVIPVLASGARRLAELMAKYERMDVCDGSLVVLSERFPRAKILTVDFRDFPVYRRFGSEPLPLLMPDRK
jgi:uncharacterized protein